MYQVTTSKCMEISATREVLAIKYRQIDVPNIFPNGNNFIFSHHLHLICATLRFND